MCMDLFEFLKAFTYEICINRIFKVYIFIFLCFLVWFLSALLSLFYSLNVILRCNREVATLELQVGNVAIANSCKAVIWWIRTLKSWTNICKIDDSESFFFVEVIIVWELPILDQLFENQLHSCDLLAWLSDVNFSCIFIAFLHNLYHPIIQMS